MKSAYEFKVERVRELPPCLDKLTSPDVSVAFWKQNVENAQWFSRDKESCVAIVVNTRYQPIAMNLISVGTVNESLITPRDFFRAVVAAGGYAGVLLHNHPSGDWTPSEPDKRVSRRLAECAAILQLEFLDSIIIGDEAHPPGYFSFRESGLI